MKPSLLIIGASGRVAAAAARRAGFTPFVLDLFADADTQLLAETVRCDDYPHGFLPLAQRLPRMRWLYTGGLENYPDLIATISQHHDLWGNAADVVRAVRDPILLSRRLRAFRRSHPRTYWPGDTIDETTIPLLRKPIRGAAGHGIRLATPADHDDANRTHYLQEQVVGEPMSAVFRDRQLLGITRQLIGAEWLHAQSFAYCGNIVSRLDLDGAAIYGFLFSELQGIWGIDFIHRTQPRLGVPSSEIAIVEVNPRFPASFEVLEHSQRRSLLVSERPIPVDVVVGKAIYYAADTFTFPSSGPWDASLKKCTNVWHRPDYADLPHVNSVIAAGQPVLTILAEAASEAVCEAQLRARAAELDTLFANIRE
jgi:uncharacterized protein